MPQTSTLVTQIPDSFFNVSWAAAYTHRDFSLFHKIKSCNHMKGNETKGKKFTHKLTILTPLFAFFLLALSVYRHISVQL